MLGVMIVLGLALVMISQSLNLQLATRDDRDWQAALAGGDAGVQHALTRVLAGVAATSFTERGTLGSVTYETAATLVDGTWHVRSVGTRGGRTRVVEAAFRRESDLPYAIFAEHELLVRGGSTIGSYDPRTGASDTGEGIAATNGRLRVAGGSDVDGAVLRGDAARCAGPGCGSVLLAGEAEPYDLGPLRDRIDDGVAQHCGGLVSSWVASRDPALVAGQTLCFSSMTFDVDTEILLASPADPVVVYVTGDVTVQRGVSVNCGGCDDGELPRAAALLLYVDGARALIGNNATVAAGLFAPDASCNGTPSNAQAVLHGGLVCSEATNHGGWSMLRDEELVDATSREWEISEWREELVSTTSIPTPGPSASP